MPPLPLVLALVARLAAPADTLAPPGDSAGASRLTIVFGAGAPQAALARGFDFTLTGGAPASRRSTAAASAQVRFLRAPDSLSAELARRVTAADRYPRVDLTLERGGSTMVIHLHDVRVLSTHLHVDAEDASLVERRLAIEESMAQLEAQQAESLRQLGALEALARDRLSPPLDLARARSDAGVIATRLAVQRQRLRLVDAQAARWLPAQEEVVLDAARAEVDVRAEPAVPLDGTSRMP